MTWPLIEKTGSTTRHWVSSLAERPQEISLGRWRAMQRQLEQDREYDRLNNSASQNDLVFWVDESAK